MKINKRVSFALLIPALAWSCGGTQPKVETEETETVQEAEKTPSLTKVWETTEDLITSESALYDAATDIIYVSNIDGDPGEKDGKGYISKLSKSGEIIEKEWVKGLDAPKGMGILNGKLYVTNLDELVEIDIQTGKISKRHKIEGAQFLNDLDIGGDKVYFTDMKAGKIHVFQNGSLSVFAENQANINGLRIGNDGTVYGLDGEGLKKYNSDGTFDLLNGKVKGGDGLIILGENEFIASRWQGEIYHIKDGKETLLLDTKGDESNTADIDFIPSDSLVIVPTFFKNKAVAYRLAY